ncbi:tetratricopeptide repeat protein [Krasilnikovia sp. MM14-A1259]|uniref:tetratricopeptide repeat protein n=1 Tax=Krasilnikovia sp. MM14-A1259 TaxID=3373539 RepID=UPI00380847D4
MTAQEHDDELRGHLRRLHTLAGGPTIASLKEHADRCGHSVSRSALAEVNSAGSAGGKRWATVDAFIDACAGYAASRRRPLSPEQIDKLTWRARFDAAQRGPRPAPRPGKGRLVGRIPPQAQCFHGRPESAELASASPSAQARVLAGLGGVGKTQLAAAHARARLAAGDLVVWVDAASRDAIVSRYADAGAQVADADAADPLRAAERFLAWLATADQPWLVVLDDLTDPADLKDLRPPGDVPTGQTLITTRLRDTALAGVGGPRLEVDVFATAEAEAYLRAALPQRLADDVAGVAADLGRLPLALGQAAAYMTDLDLDCSGYRRRFADRSRQMHELFPTADRVPDDYLRTVPVTWSLSIEAADRARPAGLARPLLELAALLDAGGVPAAVFATGAARNWLGYARAAGTDDRWPEVDADEVRDGLRQLHLFSLATADDGLVRVHDLVQRVVRDRMPADHLAAVAWAAADALVDVWPGGGREPELGARLRTNADALTRHADEQLWTVDEYHPVLAVTGMSLAEIGQVTVAAAHFHRLHATAADRLGAEHPCTLAALGNLALWQGASGDLRSTANAEQLVAARRRVHGLRHPATLTARHTLARQRMLAGDTTQALADLESLLSDRVAILGASHPDTLTTWHNLAACRGEAGDAAGAVTELTAVLADTCRFLGEEHPDALSTRHELARWRSIAGDPATAAAEFADLLAVRERVLGPDHPHTLITRSELVHATARAGDLAGPADAFTSLLADQVRILGPDHPDTLRTRLNIADAHAADDPGPGVVAELETLLDDVVRTLGPHHQLAAQSALLLALLRADEDLTMTVPGELWHACRRALGPEHPDTRAQGALVDALRDVRNRPVPPTPAQSP